MPIQPLGYPAVMNGPYQSNGQAPPLSFNLEPGMTLAIQVKRADNAQTNADSSKALAPEDRVTTTSQGLPPSRYDELNAQYAPKYPEASQAAPASAKRTLPQGLDKTSGPSQPLEWLPPSSYTDLDRTLERYYLTPSSSLPNATQAGDQGRMQGIASDIGSLSSMEETL